MGLLDDFNIDMDEIKASDGFSDAEPGFYSFTIGAAFIKDGSVANPDDQWIIIEYLLEDEDGKDGGKTSDLFGLPKDPQNLSKKELQAMGFYKSRLLDLGFDEDEINNVEGADLVGLTGTLEVYTSRGKGQNADKVYTNRRKVRVSTDEVESTFDTPEPEPAARAPRSRGAAAPTEDAAPRRRR